MLKKIGSDARRDIENLLDCKVNLKLWAEQMLPIIDKMDKVGYHAVE